MPYTLLVIDMQQWFFQTHQYTKAVTNCIAEVKHAIRAKANIIILQFAGAGKTIYPITNLTCWYDSVYYGNKNIQDGSSWVKELVDEYKLSTKLFRITGVQTNLCVQDTVEGLSHLYPKSNIHIIKDACDAAYKYDHRQGLKMMLSLPNVRVF